MSTTRDIYLTNYEAYESNNSEPTASNPLLFKKKHVLLISMFLEYHSRKRGGEGGREEVTEYY